MTVFFLVSSSTTGSLRFVASTANGSSGLPFFRNRAGYRPGEFARVLFQVGRVGDNTMNDSFIGDTINDSFTPPSVTWLKDGVPVSIKPTSTDPGNNGGLESVLTFVFRSSDAGVYQCIFTDTAGFEGSEVFLPHPIRLDTGELLTLSHESPVHRLTAK